MNHEQRSREYRAYIESYLKEFYEKIHDQPQKLLIEAMEYSLLGGGKRIRAMLAFEFCRISGRDWRDAAPFAAAMEMIHAYSLIHDDLPCMDNDDFRRGRPTNHRVFGEGIATLAGDALLTDAFLLASRAILPRSDDMARAIGLMAECAGSAGMVGGQVLDILSQERELTEKEVLDIQSRKTGGLIRGACCLGVLAGGGSEAQLQGAARFADGLGLAFQIRDDMLDVLSTREEMGTSVGTDAAKNTFVRLYGLERCEELVKAYTEQAIDALEPFADSGYLAALAESLTERRV